MVQSNTQIHDVHPVLFECIDGDAIRNAMYTIRINGSAGPSGLDANDYVETSVYILSEPIL